MMDFGSDEILNFDRSSPGVSFPIACTALLLSHLVLPLAPPAAVLDAEREVSTRAVPLEMITQICNIILW